MLNPHSPPSIFHDVRTALAHACDAACPRVRIDVTGDRGPIRARVVEDLIRHGRLFEVAPLRAHGAWSHALDVFGAVAPLTGSLGPPQHAPQSVKATAAAIASGLVEHAAAGRRPLVVVDDADHLDAPSVEALAGALQACDGIPYVLVVASTAPCPAIGEVCDTPEWITLSLLSIPTGSLDTRGPALPGGGGARELAVALTLLDCAPLTWLEAWSAHAGVDIGASLAVLQEHGVATLFEPGSVRNAPPRALVQVVHRQAALELRAALPVAVRRALAGELAAVIEAQPDADRVYAQRALARVHASAGNTGAAVRTLVHAACSSERRMHYAAAFDDYSAAHGLEPASSARRELRLRMAEVATTGADDRAFETWTALARDCAAAGDDDGYARALFHQFWTARDGTAVDRLHRAASLGPDRIGWSARAAACRHTLAERYHDAIGCDRRALGLARSVGDERLEALALDKLAVATAYVGELSDAQQLLRASIAISARLGRHESAVTGWLTLADMLADDLRPLEQLAGCDEAMRHVERFEVPQLRSVVGSCRALTLAALGRYDEAIGEARRAFVADPLLEGCPYSTVVSSQVAQVAVEAGDTVLAADAVTFALASAQRLGYASFEFEVRCNQLRLEAACGQIEAVARGASGMDSDEPAARARLAVWLMRTAVCTGDATLKRRALELRARHDGLGGRLTHLLTAEIDALCSALDGAPEYEHACHEVHGAWEAAGRHAEAARFAGAVVVATADAQTLSVRLRPSCSRLNELGALSDAAIFAAIIRSAGGRIRLRSLVPSLAAGELSQRESEIAMMAARGLRNVDICARLQLSRTTVEKCIASIHRKAGTASRTELSGWVRDMIARGG